MEMKIGTGVLHKNIYFTASNENVLRILFIASELRNACSSNLFVKFYTNDMNGCKSFDHDEYEYHTIVIIHTDFVINFTAKFEKIAVLLFFDP